MNTSSSIYSKRRQGRNPTPLDAIGSEIESFDIGTNALFKVALYKGVPSGSNDVSEIFIAILKKSLAENSKISPYRLFSFLSFHYFKKKFTLSALEEVKSMRSNWILLQCDVTALSGLDSKSSQYYFYSLERRLFEDYVTGWPTAQNWLESEFQKVRKKFLISLLKKYSNFSFFGVLFF